MGQFGLTAVEAVEIYKKGIVTSPAEAWDKSAQKNTPSETTQEKGCPRSTFLGLCEEGLICCIPQGNYTDSKDNKSYGIKAVDYLKNNPLFEKSSPIKLWEAIGNADKCHNQQMDVVIALWNAGVIK
jgi:hypothetical protein